MLQEATGIHVSEFSYEDGDIRMCSYAAQKGPRGGKTLVASVKCGGRLCVSLVVLILTQRSVEGGVAG